MKPFRQNINSDSPWGNIVGYSRAVKAGNLIEISGTTSVAGDTVIGNGDVYSRAVFI